MNFYRLVPEWIKQKLYAAIAERQLSWRKQEAAKIPVPQLADRHISNLKPLLNRRALLERLPENAVVAEVGVAAGSFSKEIQQICRPQQLHLIDLWNSARYGQSLRKEVETGFRQHIKNGEVFIHVDDSIKAASKFPDHHFDWIYLDTDHSYEQTRLELLAYQSKIKPEGIIAGHDFILGNWVSGIRYGVIEAVYEFCVAYEWELVFMTMDYDEFPSFAITKRPSPPPQPKDNIGS